MTVDASTTEVQATQLCNETASNLGLSEANVQGCELSSGQERVLEEVSEPLKTLEMQFGVETEDIANSAKDRMAAAIQVAAEAVGIAEPTIVTCQFAPMPFCDEGKRYNYGFSVNELSQTA